ncbi:MAG: small acid-soluble spore protein [Peptococcaceae bacterium]|nr:small acid-soluble spore protein [Peptococcaceae bacterium]
MGHKKNFNTLRTARALDRLQWETAKEVGLTAGHKNIKGLTFPENADAPDPEDTEELVKAAEEVVARESTRKTEANLKEAND